MGIRAWVLFIFPGKIEDFGRRHNDPALHLHLFNRKKGVKNWARSFLKADFEEGMEVTWIFISLKGRRISRALFTLQLMGGLQGFPAEEHLSGIAQPLGGHARLGNPDEFEVKIDSQASPRQRRFSPPRHQGTKKSENQGLDFFIFL